MKMINYSIFFIACLFSLQLSWAMEENTSKAPIPIFMSTRTSKNNYEDKKYFYENIPDDQIKHVDVGFSSDTIIYTALLPDGNSICAYYYTKPQQDTIECCLHITEHSKFFPTATSTRLYPLQEKYFYILQRKFKAQQIAQENAANLGRMKQ